MAPGYLQDLAELEEDCFLPPKSNEFLLMNDSGADLQRPHSAGLTDSTLEDLLLLNEVVNPKIEPRISPSPTFTLEQQKNKSNFSEFALCQRKTSQKSFLPVHSRLSNYKLPLSGINSNTPATVTTTPTNIDSPTFDSNKRDFQNYTSDSSAMNTPEPMLSRSLDLKSGETDCKSALTPHTGKKDEQILGSPLLAPSLVGTTSVSLPRHVQIPGHDEHPHLLDGATPPRPAQSGKTYSEEALLKIKEEPATALSTRTAKEVMADLKRATTYRGPELGLDELHITREMRPSGSSAQIIAVGDDLAEVDVGGEDHEAESGVDEEEIDTDKEEELISLPKIKKLTARKRRYLAAADEWMQKRDQKPIKEANVQPENETQSARWLVDQMENRQIISTPREYQLELFEKAKEKNIVAVLDTGSGKTLIAVLLLRHVFAQELEDRALGQPKRISFFLVDSVQLVFQQHAVLKANLDQPMNMFCGDMGVDLWKKESWDKHFSENMVIVCTAEASLFFFFPCECWTSSRS